MTQEENAPHVVEMRPSEPVPRWGSVVPEAGRRKLSFRTALHDLVGILSGARMLVLGTAVGSIALAIVYLWVRTPIYAANVVLQVEERPSLGNPGQPSSTHAEGTATEVAIELLRSRALLERVVDQLRLDIQVRPRTFPLVGAAIARQRHELATPLLGLTQYAWGGERVSVQRLAVSEDLLAQPLRLVSMAASQFRVEGPQGVVLATGEVHKPMAGGSGSTRIEGSVSELVARPGTSFVLTKRRRADVVEQLQGALRVEERGKKTGILQIAMEGDDPDRVSSIVAAVADTYVRQNAERRSSETARIVDPALVPHQPVGPESPVLLALSLVCGLGAGIAAALIRHALDVDDEPAEVERASGVPVCATVPHSASQEKIGRMMRRRSRSVWPILAAVDPGDVAIENLRSLRTSVQLALAAARSNIIALEGPRPGLGKSFVAVNFAHLLAAAGQNVLVIDGDLRRGMIHRYFGVDRRPGLSESLSGAAALDDAIRTTAFPHLDVLPTGRIPQNPAELLASSRVRDLLSEVSRRYEVVVIDTPPVLAVTDSALIARTAGVNLLVLRAGCHPAREIAATVRRLAQNGIQIHGAVVNDVSEKGHGFRDRYYQYEYRSIAGEQGT